MSEPFGIVYVATGNQHRAECTRSAKSAKHVMPDIRISVWTDDEAGLDKHCFDAVHVLHTPRCTSFDKIAPLLETNYDKTLFLDTDTYFLESVYELSALLDRFELAYAHAPRRISPGTDSEDVPACFPEANTGVLAYRKCASLSDLITTWKSKYEVLQPNGAPRDQPAFRRAVYYSEVRSTVLPPEYNLRTVFPLFKGARSRAKILHGREPSLSRAIRKIRGQDGFVTHNFNRRSMLARAVNKLRRRIRRKP